jgi:acetolactate synthase-1/2/3 large subunit
MWPQHIVQNLRAALEPHGLVVCDVGAHKHWMARMFPCEVSNTCIISNGFAAMGLLCRVRSLESYCIPNGAWWR